jgi:quinol-cytochrome oxidoreductase complex cytochrome b subunit
MVEENPVKFLVPEDERNKVLSEIFVRSRQYITVCMVLETVRMVYLNSSNYQPYELITWILEILCLFVMLIIVLKSYK